MNKEEIIHNLDTFVSSRGTGCYVFERPTLQNPNPYSTVYGVGKSFDNPIQQSRNEIYALIDVIMQIEPRNVILETGAGEWVGSHFLWKMLFDKVITVEKTQEIIDKITYDINSDQDIFIIGDSLESLDNVKSHTNSVDVLFLDSIHTYNMVLNEYMLYSPLVRDGGLIVFHDAISTKFPDIKQFLSDLKLGKIDHEMHHNIAIIDDSPGKKSPDATSHPIGIGYIAKNGFAPIQHNYKWYYL